MIFRVEHRTRYRFSQPVFLEPHELRLRPRCDGIQELLDFSLRVEPRPAGLSEALDAENNPGCEVWFDGTHEELDIVTTSRIRTTRDNPFDFLLPTRAQRLPLVLDRTQARLLAHCLARSHDQGPDDPVTLLARDVVNDCEGWTMEVLLALNLRLFERVAKVEREEPGLLPPAETLTRGQGACRDVALVFMEACRALGLPARFTSGYHEGDPDLEDNELHGWAEIFLPGAGWRGYDPTLGLAVADRHVALCASANPLLTAPVRGSFRGTGAVSELRTLIRMEREHEP